MYAFGPLNKGRSLNRDYGRKRESDQGWKDKRGVIVTVITIDLVHISTFDTWKM
jgi:hypothetical protein